MKSMVSINSVGLLKESNSAFTVTALNGSSALSPLTGTFTWNGTTYTQLFAFTALSGTNSINLSQTKTCGILLVAGGGGGGCSNWNSSAGGGGGGAGGVIYGTLQFTGGATYTITIGSGGTKGIASTQGSANPSTNCVAPTAGGNSQIIGTGISETAFGGGRGAYSFGSPNTTSNSGGNGGSGGGHQFTNSGSVAGQATMSQANCSSSTNTRSLTYAGYNGGLGNNECCSGGGGGATMAGKDGTVAGSGVGGTGYQLVMTGTSNAYNNQYYATGGCGGMRTGGISAPNQTSITSVGGVIGGNTTNPVPLDPTTYGTAGSGGFGLYGGSTSSNAGNNNGSNGMRGICIILIP